MPSGDLGSVKSKIAFFDAFVKANTGVDPVAMRAKARIKPQLTEKVAIDLPPPEMLASEARTIEPLAEKAPPKPRETIPEDAGTGGYFSSPIDPRLVAEERFRMKTDAGEVAEGLAEEADKHSEPDDPNGLNLTRKALGDKYVGEERGEGWRTGTGVRTKHFSAEEREQSKVNFAPAGRSFDLGNSAVGYVMSPETGDVHQFKLNENNGGIHTHHSSPLAGGDVAGAGMIKAEDGRITTINDQSGHYKPGADLTFQAVRQINMASMSNAIRDKLRRRPAVDGKGEGDDTIEQLVASEIGALRDEYFAELDREQDRLVAKAGKLLDREEREHAMLAIDKSRQQKANEFRDTARKVEQELLASSGGRTLLRGTSGLDVEPRLKATLSPQARQLLDVSDILRLSLARMQNGRDTPEEISAQRAKLEKVEGLLRVVAPNLYANKEARVDLLGKTGMLTDAEYDANSGGYNRASALKQLSTPLGDKAFAALLIQPKKTGDASAVEQAMRERNITPGVKGAVAALKAQLGKEAADEVDRAWQSDEAECDRLDEERDRLKTRRREAKAAGQAVEADLLKDQISDIDDRIAAIEDRREALEREYGVVAVRENLGKGPEMAGFEIGQKSTVSLTAQQFLQTGGNEAQIRTKDRLMSEVEEIGAIMEELRAARAGTPSAPSNGEMSLLQEAKKLLQERRAKASQPDKPDMEDEIASLAGRTGEIRSALDSLAGFDREIDTAREAFEGQEAQTPAWFEAKAALAAAESRKDSALRDLCADAGALVQTLGAIDGRIDKEIEDAIDDDDDDEEDRLKPLKEQVIETLLAAETCLSQAQRAASVMHSERHQPELESVLAEILSDPAVRRTVLTNRKKDLKYTIKYGELSKEPKDKLRLELEQVTRELDQIDDDD